MRPQWFIIELSGQRKPLTMSIIRSNRRRGLKKCHQFLHTYISINVEIIHCTQLNYSHPWAPIAPRSPRPPRPPRLPRPPLPRWWPLNWKTCAWVWYRWLSESNLRLGSCPWYGLADHTTKKRLNPMGSLMAQIVSPWSRPYLQMCLDNHVDDVQAGCTK